MQLYGKPRHWYARFDLLLLSNNQRIGISLLACVWYCTGMRFREQMLEQYTLRPRPCSFPLSLPAVHSETTFHLPMVELCTASTFILATAHSIILSPPTEEVQFIRQGGTPQSRNRSFGIRKVMIPGVQCSPEYVIHQNLMRAAFSARMTLTASTQSLPG